MKKLKIFEGNIKAIFEKYTEFDESIAKMACKYQMYLIGGTAIDFLCNYYNLPSWRHRSNNDLDFWISNDNKNLIMDFTDRIIQQHGFDIKEYSDYMISLQSDNIKTDVDLLVDFDSNNKKFCNVLNGIGVMSPIYLFSSKFDRYLNSTNQQRRETDFKDLQLLLKMIDKINGFDDLEYHLSNQNYDEKAELELNKIIESVS